MGRAEPGDTTFVDDSALPATRYTYVVESVHDGRFLRSETIRVKTPPASLSLARLDGVYAIDARNTSHFGLTGVVNNLASGWRFRPVCRRGPCDVTWKDAQRNPLSGRLERSGAHYEGTGSSKFATCGNVSSMGTLTLRFEVVRAESVRNAWRASKLVGHVRRALPAQLGCVGAGVDYDITPRCSPEATPSHPLALSFSAGSRFRAASSSSIVACDAGRSVRNRAPVRAASRMTRSTFRPAIFMRSSSR